MTKLKRDKPAWETLGTAWDRGSRRPIVIRIQPEGVTISQKGRRMKYHLSWSAVYLAAVESHVNRRARVTRILKKSLNRRPRQAEIDKVMKEE